jgi:macrolide phosphotransferase
VTLEAYASAGREAHDGLAAQARHLWDASPIGYALYALTTGADADRAAAAALLDPPA